MSVQERIRALNIQQGSSGDGSSPSRSPTNPKQNQIFSRTNPPSPGSVYSKTSSLSSDKAQLFKAAKVIQKSFSAESDSILSRKRAAAAGKASVSARIIDNEPSHDMNEENADDSGGSEESEEVLDASAAMKFWQTKGVNDGALSYKEFKKKENKGMDALSATTDNGQLPPPPDIVRSANTDSDLEQVEDENNYLNGDDREAVLPLTSTEDMMSMRINEDEPLISEQSAGDGAPYRAYARRSRLRSPRGTVTSPENSIEMDGTQSVLSAYSASSQVTSQTQTSSLSSRATKFLKDKKDRRKGAAPGNQETELFAKDIVQNNLLGKASNARMKERAAAAVTNHEEEKGDHLIKMKSPFDEPTKGRETGSTPQTIDLQLQPVFPQVNHGVSELKRDVGERRRQQHRQQMDISESSKSRDVPSSIQLSRDYSKKNQRGGNSAYTSSTNESSYTSIYSELKAKDLFDVGNQGNDMKIQSASPQLNNATLESNTESNADFATFPRKGKSFDNGCQLFDAVNPLIESAFDMLGASDQSKFCGSKTGHFVSKTFCNETNDEAPSDEDVAIEVEYVEPVEEQQVEEGPSYETDSYSMSTRDLSSTLS